MEKSIREDIQLDKDTKSVPGSPPIFDTILRKIEKAAIFIPDLTFVGKSDGDEPIPNPNVLIEYGFALRTVGHHRIVGVMNAAYGPPESLPFDLVHHRFPITYKLPEGASDQVPTTSWQLRGRIGVLPVWRTFLTVICGKTTSDENRGFAQFPPLKSRSSSNLEMTLVTCLSLSSKRSSINAA